jgi:hypothetical protein
MKRTSFAHILVLGAAAFLSACTQPVPPGTAGKPAPTHEDALASVAATAAAIADASRTAPPATITAKVTIDDRLLDIALDTFETTLTIIDSFVATGVIERGSPKARNVRDAIVFTRLGFLAASSAQNAGNAQSYRSALAEIKLSLRSLEQAILQTRTPAPAHAHAH